MLGFPCRSDVSATAQSCRQILDNASITGYEVGKTKVFMRYFHADELNEKLHPYSEAATILSKYMRGFTARSKYGAMVAEKRAQDEAVATFINSIERSGQGTRDVVSSLIEEDEKKHPRQFGAPPPDLKPKAAKSKKKGKGMARAASVKWFKEEEVTKGSGKTDDALPPAAPAPATGAPAGGSVVDELAKLKGLFDAGAITDEEFSAAKAKVLGL